MSKRSLEELVTRSDISRERRNGQDKSAPNAAALIRRAAHDIGMLKAAAHS